MRQVRIADPSVVRPRLSTRPSDGDPVRAAALADGLTGARPGPVIRLGKRLGWTFHGPRGEVAVLVHLGMTGNWGLRAEPPRHGRLVLHLDDGTALWFVDARRFGCVVPVAPDALGATLGDGLGPDALEAPPDGPGLASRLRGARPIKVALLDQARLAGVGNIQAAEALHRCGLHPATPCRDLRIEDWDRLAVEIPAQLRAAIAAQDGGEIEYLTQGGDNPFAVYGRGSEPCPRCSTAIVSAKMGGRATFWCPACQPAPSAT